MLDINGEKRVKIIKKTFDTALFKWISDVKGNQTSISLFEILTFKTSKLRKKK